MTYKGPFCYTLFLSGNEDQRVITEKVYEGKVTNFKSPLTDRLTPKIYILKQNDEIVYVGYASQSIGTRLGQGIKANGSNGYHGYKWKQANELQLLVFVFEQNLIGKKHKEDELFIKLAESVEAELVYLTRQKTGKWPRFQNEIHFNNDNLIKAKKIAAEIYDVVEIEKNYSSKTFN